LTGLNFIRLWCSRQLILLPADKNNFEWSQRVSPSGIWTAFVIGVNGATKHGWGWQMKIQNILRTHVVVMGFAAACLLAGGTRAQEIDNTVWADSSSVEVFPQPVHAAVTNDARTVATNSIETDTTAVIALPSVSNEAVVSGGFVREGWVIAASIMLMAPLAVLLLAKVRRARQSVNARAYHTKRSAALS
jgi:hypothetical protein